MNANVADNISSNYGLKSVLTVGLRVETIMIASGRLTVSAVPTTITIMETDSVMDAMYIR